MEWLMLDTNASILFHSNLYRMNILKRKWALCYMKILPAVSKLEVCDKLRPYLRHYGLTLSDTEIIFPKRRCYYQKLLQFIYAYGIYEESIPYESVIYIMETPVGLHLLLRTGHEFTFTLESPHWQIRNLYDYDKPLMITVCWWRFSGQAVMLWWKVEEWLGIREKKQPQL